jgi:hypothetical protein
MIVDAHVHVFPKLSGVHNGCRLESYQHGKWRVTAPLEKFESLRQQCIAGGDPTLLDPANFGKLADNEYWLRPWAPFIDEGFTPELYAEFMDTYGVDKAVILQSPTYYLPDLNEYIAAAVRKRPDRFHGAAQIDPMDGQVAAQELQKAVKLLGLRSLKLELAADSGWMQFHPNLKLDGKEVTPIWQMATGLEIPVVFDIGHPGCASYQPEALKRIAEEFPNMKIVIAHLAGGRMRDLNEKAWKQVIQLGRCPNVWLTTEPIGGSDLDCLRIVYEEIGSDKLIWGTDYPWWSKLYNYNVLISVMKQCDFLSEKEKKDIMGENALRVFEFKS